ncbi:hypothetical protein [Mesorhizobium kowhaii]|uniref:hypothetical protein n=1 Tax=Mesorhizobium kowhaii TaxID=1300272 RepID=UPI0011B3A15E|nr:hypothetical protein [Mesorhizobium kowhaii]
MAARSAAGVGTVSDTKPADSEQFRITHVTPAYWQVTINRPPFNIFGPDAVPELARVLTQIERDPKLDMYAAR